jgi:NADH dehydrogenase
MTLHADDTITIFGGTGFVGRYVVARLAKTGAHIRIITRAPAAAYFLKPYGAVGQITALSCDLSSDEAVEKITQGSTVIINLIGILFEKGKKNTFTNIHADLPARIAKAAAVHNVKSFIHVSAIGARKDAPSAYLQSKGKGEEVILKTFPRAIILRPSVIFGMEDGFINLFARLSSFSPFLPLIRKGQTEFQPVYVDDVAAAVEKVANAPSAAGKIYELGGPKIYSFKDILSLILLETNRKRLLLPLPTPIAIVQAMFFELMPRPLLTRDQIKSLKAPNIVTQDALTLEDLNLTPTALEAMLPKMLASFQKGGAFAKRGLSAIALIIALTLTTPAMAQKQNAIAAVVNDDIISMLDLTDRMKLIMFGSNIPPTPENIARLQPQVLNTLIDESLQMQEAKALNITVTDEQINQGLITIAQNNKVDPAEFQNALQKGGVNINTLKDQVRTEIAWSQLMTRKLAPQINISEADIDAAIDQMARKEGQTEYWLADILLKLPENADEAMVAETMRKAEMIISEVEKGKRFSELALQYSDAPGANRGGDLGWVSLGQLDPAIDAVLPSLTPNMMSKPIRGREGIHILFLRNIRQAGLPGLPPASSPALAGEGTATHAAPPDRNDEALRNRISSGLGQQRLQNLQNQYLQDLKATAFIEKRVQ